ncbi:MAG: diadenylate cyclase CdaA [Eubacteriales bacterium]|nr:diadenylate cyclase CdaA [Christensenellaceae bacterium]MEA5066929.1 diadenylate cyclase CdaA [Eubacteriales bacterium]
MAGLRSAGVTIASLFANLFDLPDWRNVLDILIVAVVIYQVLKMFKHTRVGSVVKGVAIVLLFTWLSEVLALNAINWLLQQVLGTGAVLLIVLFQPELRRTLEQIGRRRDWSRLVGSGSRENRRISALVEELVNALMELSRKRIGALVVAERRTGLSDIVESGTRLDAEISAALVENIFEPNTPLHDGAVILRDDRIVAAGCILPLTDNNALSRELGTRHRAALGISEMTDAVSLIVSEETGIISTARDGRLTRHLDRKTLTALLTELFQPTELTARQLLARWKEGQREE